MNIELPKWPQALIWGKTVSEAQAKDIIRRTDYFLTSTSDYTGGNNRDWNKQVRKLMGVTHFNEVLERIFGKEGCIEKFTHETELRKLLGWLDIDYLKNDWASSAFVYGPLGWCHPSGKIHFTDSIGKWPTTEEVLQELNTLHAAFPYLDLTCTLIDQGYEETDEKKPLISFRVKDGVQVLDTPVLPPDTVARSRTREEEMEGLRALVADGREQGLPAHWISEYATITKPIIEKFLKDNKLV